MGSALPEVPLGLGGRVWVGVLVRMRSRAIRLGLLEGL